MPSKDALLGELGWLPIKDELAIKRISYFIHLNNMPQQRLAKRIFDELKFHNQPANNSFPYFAHIEKIYQDYGADHLYQHLGNHDISAFKNAVHNDYQQRFNTALHSHSSLRYYRALKSSTDCSAYLLSSIHKFKAIQLKFKLRVGVSTLGEDTHRQRRGDGRCPFCNEFETLKHFTFQCQTYDYERQLMLKYIFDNVDGDIFNIFIQDLDCAMGLLLGEHDTIFNTAFLTFVDKAWMRRSD